MTPSGIGAGGSAHPRRRAAAGFAVLALLGLLLGSLGDGPARAAARANPLASITIAGLQPAVGTPGGVLRVTGTVQAGGERLGTVRVSLLLSRTPVGSRSELAGVAAGHTTGKDGPVVASERVADTLQPGDTAAFEVSRALSGLHQLDTFGVYVVGVQVSATHRGGSGPVATTRTFLPWVPAKHSFQPTGFTWLWPLVAHPVRLADGSFTSDAISREIAGDGRLSRLVAAGERLGRDVPLSWVVDPDLLDTVDRMTAPDGYTVVRHGRERKGGGALAADAWLAALRSSTATSSVVALPYADPDVVALRRGDLTGDITAARETGTDVATRVLGRDVTDDVAVPVDGSIDRATLALLKRTGTDAVVLDGSAQPPKLELNYTPSGRADVSTAAGRVTTLLADTGLRQLLSNTSEQPVLAAQRFIAETAMITAELPSGGSDRVVLVAPPRRWSPPQAFLDQLVEGMDGAAWMSGTALAGMRTAPSDEVEREPLRYPRLLRRRELPAPYLTALRSQHTRIATFSGVLTQPDRLVPDLERAVLRLESSWWRVHPSRVNRLNTENVHLATLVESIRVQPGSYTFGSKSGTIPLTVANGIDQDVVVDLRLDPQQARLRLSQPGRIRIGPNRKVQIPVKASAVATGTVLVNATLYTPGGTVFSPEPVQLRIRITQYGTVALAITGAAAGILVIASVLRLSRRARAARRNRGGAGPDDSGPDGGGPGGDAPDDGLDRPLDDPAGEPVDGTR